MSPAAAGQRLKFKPGNNNNTAFHSLSFREKTWRCWEDEPGESYGGGAAIGMLLCARSGGKTNSLKGVGRLGARRQGRGRGRLTQIDLVVTWICRISATVGLIVDVAQ